MVAEPISPLVQLNSITKENGENESRKACDDTFLCEIWACDIWLCFPSRPGDGIRRHNSGRGCGEGQENEAGEKQDHVTLATTSASLLLSLLYCSFH